jgi:hypothetical protein
VVANPCEWTLRIASAEGAKNLMRGALERLRYGLWETTRRRLFGAGKMKWTRSTANRHFEAALGGNAEGKPKSTRG